MQNDWNAQFVERHPLFAPLAHLVPYWSAWSDWPDLPTCNALLQSAATPIIAADGITLRAVAQDGRPEGLAGHYEMRIHKRGELQTRTGNWHDWFNLLVWRSFPRSKRLLNATHCAALAETATAKAAIPPRNSRAHACTLFDENGAVILASDPALLELIRAFRWRELFWVRRESLTAAMRCVVFGHSLYEKALQPYIGMTAHAILLPVSAEILQRPWESLLVWLDATLAAHLVQPQSLATPRALQPFPLLGMPGWDPANAKSSYYDNTAYFRKGRQSPEMLRGI